MNTRYLIRVLVLLLYCAYAISPIYATFPAADASDPDRQLERIDTTIGEMWLKLCLTKLTNGDPDDPDGDGAKDVTILIKKKRAVLRIRDRVAPLQVACCLAVLNVPGCDAPIQTYSSTPHARPLAEDGYRYTSTGLSPPHLSV